MFPACDLYQIPSSEYQRHAVPIFTQGKMNVPSETATENEAFKSAVFQRLFAITVPARSKDTVLGLVSRLQTVLEGIVMQGASGAFTTCIVEDVKLVGHYQKDTTIVGHQEMIAELVVKLKTAPSATSLNDLAVKIIADLNRNFPSESFGFGIDNHRIVISSGPARVIVHISTSTQSTQHGENGTTSTDTIPNSVFETSARLVEEANWFAANASASNIKGVVRLLTDLRHRQPAFACLNDAALDTLAHFCVTAVVDDKPLSIETAFRRFLELVSMGILQRETSWPATELFQSGPVDAASRAAATLAAVNLLCEVSQGKFRSALNI